LGEAVLPKGGVCVLAGLSGSRKTWLMLQMAISLATGRDLFGLHTAAPAEVLLLECESSRTHLRRRLRNILAGIGIDALPKLHLLSQQGTIPRIGTALEQCVRQTQAEVVILDTHGYFWDGEENSNSDWKQKVFAPLKEISRSCAWSPSFVLVHHFGKSDSGVGNRSRGATAIENDASSVLYLDRKKDSDVSVLRFKKIRDGEELPDITLEFDREKYLLIPVEVPADGSELPAHDLRMYEWVTEYARLHGPFKPQDVTAKIIEEFGVDREVARRVPTNAAAAGRLKRLKKGLYTRLHG
jgi:RecA-family ATPase